MHYTSLSFLLLYLLTFSAAQPLKHVTFSPTAEPIINPERGIYHVRVTGMTPGKVTPYDPLTSADLLWMRTSSSLLFRYFGLKQWRTRSLPDSILQKIEQDFTLIRASGLKAIIRFAYAAGMGEPDAPLHIILRHLDQLEPVIRRNSDIIAVMQAGFIGAWGEWHSSSNGNDSPENMKRVLLRILDVLPRSRMVQVRAPSYKRRIFNLAEGERGALTIEQAFNGSHVSRVGHHNDCFLADASDMGTYMRGSFLDTLRSKEYLQLDSRFVPLGGETCQVSEFSECDKAPHEFSRLHWSFLNGDYDEPTLEGFVKGGCMNVIREKLGYRFRLLWGEFSPAVGLGGVFTLKLAIVNEGWAAPYNERGVEIILRNTETSELYSASLSVDPRRWFSRDTIRLNTSFGIPAHMRKGTYAILLNLFDPAVALRFRAEYSIRLANSNTWEAPSGFNNLLDSVRIVVQRGADVYRGQTWFTRRNAR